MNKRKIVLFLGLTFLFTWMAEILFYLLGGKLHTAAATITLSGVMFIPMVMSILVQKFYREQVIKPLGVSFKLNRWFVLAWLLPPLMAFATLGVSLLWPGVGYSPEMTGMFERYKSMLPPEQLEQMRNQIAVMPVHPLWLGLLQGLIAGVSINAVAGFGEELGWRGFLQKELNYMGFWKSSLFIGFIWGIWHAPIILQGYNYPQHPVLGAVMMTALGVLLGPVFSYLRIKARSVIAAAVAHGTFNATSGLAVLLVHGGNDLIIGSTGIAGLIVLALVNLGILVLDRSLKGNFST